MLVCKYAICCYYPSLARLDQAFDYAVLAATRSSLALVGMNLAAYGLQHQDPVAQSGLTNTFHITARSLDRAFRQLRPGETCLALLCQFAVCRMSCFQYRPVEAVETCALPAEIARRQFRKLLDREAQRLARPVEYGDWSERTWPDVGRLPTLPMPLAA